MSFWVHAFCIDSVASVTPQELADGVADRLSLLTHLFCPDEEEAPGDVLARLRIDDHSPDGTFRVFQMRYRAEADAFIRVERGDRGGIDELQRDVLSRRTDPAVDKARAMLANATEDVSFCLKPRDVNAMGFPLSIAAAAYLVEKAGGLIQSGAYSWMVPCGREVRIIAEITV